jgi:short-subunit dehydrogenase
MTRVADKTVLVTGAGMGMGRMHAERAVELGAARVVLWDYNENALAEAADALRGRGAAIHTYVVDVSDVEAVGYAGARTLDDAGPVHILINNAGVVAPGAFPSQTHEDIERVMRVNALGAMHVVRAFLDAMIQSPEAHIVNISSASALMPLPFGAVYAASKWAVYCWSESLRIELVELGHGQVRVTTVCPSFVATGMFEGARAPAGTRFLKTREVVDATWKAVRRNKALVLIPFLTRTALPMRALLPRPWFDFVARRVFGVYTAMRSLRGREGQAASPPASASERIASTGSRR